jgi:hypothetical protein
MPPTPAAPLESLLSAQATTNIAKLNEARSFMAPIWNQQVDNVKSRSELGHLSCKGDQLGLAPVRAKSMANSKRLSAARATRHNKLVPRNLVPEIVPTG